MQRTENRKGELLLKSAILAAGVGDVSIRHPWWSSLPPLLSPPYMHCEQTLDVVALKLSAFAPVHPRSMNRAEQLWFETWKLHHHADEQDVLDVGLQRANHNNETKLEQIAASGHWPVRPATPSQTDNCTKSLGHWKVSPYSGTVESCSIQARNTLLQTAPGCSNAKFSKHLQIVLPTRGSPVLRRVLRLLW